MVGHMDVIEVHPPHQIFQGPTLSENGRTSNNTIYNWLQLLNQGKRIMGVVNTDAHYNFHGSGWLRNYLRSPTDDPAEIKTLDVVHAAERGRLVMTNGPFLEASLRANRGPTAEAGPGEDLTAPGGEATLHVRVQCPNWFDVDRVQVFVNGRPVESLNFTRKGSADRFSGGTMKFDQEIPSSCRGCPRDRGGDRRGVEARPVVGPEHAATARWPCRTRSSWTSTAAVSRPTATPWASSRSSNRADLRAGRVSKRPRPDRCRSGLGRGPFALESDPDQAEVRHVAGRLARSHPAATSASSKGKTRSARIW